MNKFTKKIKVAVTLVVASLSIAVNAQSFVPSQQQINQFKNLPRAQQEQLAKQMGFDLSILEQSAGSGKQSSAPEADFVKRELDNNSISESLAKQSVVEELSVKLKPFGYDIFEAREEATKPSANSPVPSNYIIGPGDSVNLQLFGKETGSFELVVNNEGNVDVPELGPLNVAGTSFIELKNLIKEKYEQQKIGVSPFVSMGQLRTIQIFLVGEVYRPGPLVVSGMSTITTALINSGGVNKIGSLRNVQLKRNGKTVAHFDLYDLIVYGDTAKDVSLEQGDVLFVPTAQTIVSLEGQVRRPAIYEIIPGETIADLFKLSGGFLPSADTSSIQLVRSYAQDGLSIVNVDYLKGNGLTTKLRNGDFVRIPKANQEFNNAIVINGAVNLPSVIANTNLSLNDLITSENILANTDLDYALLLRRGRFSNTSEVIQFKPIDVINAKFDTNLQAYDELFLFNRVAKDQVTGITEAVTKQVLETSLDDIRSTGDDLVQQLENDRFTSKLFSRKSNADFSRKELLAPVIARLKSEASDKTPVQLVEVSGQVKYPGVYPLASNSSLQSVIASAGGLTESAHLESAEITSVSIIDGVSEVRHKRVNLLNHLLLPTSQQIKLKSKDVLNVVRIPQWFENNTITIKGEVTFPGTYQVSAGETLSNVIKRAGGITDKATIKAAVFSREELKEKERANIDKAIEDIRQQLANNNLSNSQFSRTIDYESATEVLNDLSNVEALGRMVIDLEALLLDNKLADIEVKNGDTLIIPNITPAVSVIGEVFVSTTYLFDSRLTVKDYIELAGGVREYGDEAKLYIVRANGSVLVPRSDFWFASADTRLIEPGDTIVVPRDVTNYENISLWQGVTQILYQSAVALAAIGSL